MDGDQRVERGHHRDAVLCHPLVVVLAVVRVDLRNRQEQLAELCQQVRYDVPPRRLGVLEGEAEAEELVDIPHAYYAGT